LTKISTLEKFRRIYSCSVSKFVRLVLPLSPPIIRSSRDDMSFCFGAFRARKSKPTKLAMDGQDFADYCIFCEIARRASSTNILFSVGSLFVTLNFNFVFDLYTSCHVWCNVRANFYQDEKVAAFPDINPSAFRYYFSSFVYTHQVNYERDQMPN
jgi:hypothetical protein